MDASVFRFNAKQLRAIPTRHLGFLVASGHCCNELAILLPYIIFEHDLKRANEVECAFILTRKFAIDRILISKIVEYGDLCSKFFKGSSGTSDQLLAELSKNYEPIAIQIKSAKWARILRNKISFHYDYEQALSALSRLDDDHPMRLIAGRIKGLTLFDFAEEIVSRPIFVGSISSFHAHRTISLFKSCGLISKRVQTKLREKYCAAPGDVRVPISISSAYLNSRKSKDFGNRKRAR